MELQLSSGQGPAECELAVGKLLFSLMGEFSDIKVLECKPEHRKKENVKKENGKKENCYRSVRIASETDLSFLEGTVQWICKSPFRPHHGRKNWFVDISLCHEKQIDVFDKSLVKFETFRSGGKGGQNVNKVETGVRALYLPLGLTTVCTEERSQRVNRQIALTRLEEIVIARNTAGAAFVRSLDWLQHTQIKRGNPVRVYEGMEFRLVWSAQESAARL
ncbi:MAG: peptide chain release factor H [Synergistaceae bacterium]|jgi:peptide chain release factor|nr:peptide chain release factor H [Synergistaceae bacterium]